MSEARNERGRALATRAVVEGGEQRELIDSYRALLESLDDGFCILELIFDASGTRGIDYRFIELNTSFAQHTGLVDAKGKRVLELVPDIDPFWAATYGNVALTGRALRFERHEPSMERSFEVQAIPVGAPQSRRVAVVFRDITPRRETEERLRASENTLRSFYESTTFMMGIVELPDDDSDIVHLYDTPASHRFFGLTHQANEPQSARALGVPDAVRAQWVKRYRAAEREHREVRFTYEHPAPAGPRTLVSVVACLGRGRAGYTRFSYVTEDVTERQRVEQRMRDREMHLRLAMEASLSVAFEWDIPNDSVRRLQSSEEAFPETTGQPDTLEGVARVVHPEDREQFRANIRAALGAEDGVYRSEHRIVRPSGEVRWHLEAGRVEFDDDRRPMRLIGISQDVTELRASEERAHAAAERAEADRSLLNAILDAAPVGIIVADAGGKLVRFNRANEQLWGAAPYSSNVDEYREWKGWWADHSPRHGRRLEVSEWAMARALQGETVRGHIVEIEPFGLPGVRRTMVNTGAPVRDSEGHVTGAVIAQMDISELVAAENARRESERRFRAIADAIPALFFVHTSCGHTTFVNQSFCAFTGRAADELLGHRWKETVHPDDLARSASSFHRAVEEQRAFEAEYRVRRHDGIWRWYLARSVPQQNPDGSISHWIATATDITERMRDEDALKQADRRKDEFIAILAHELRNPLAPVRNAVEILRLRGASDPLLQRARDVIDRQVTHMARLIDDLLDVSRIARGQLALRTERCDLATIAWQTTEDYRANLESSGLRLALASAGPMWVEGDPVRLAQMIGNLLNNAGRFTERGGCIEVRTEAREGTARVTVTDTGVGIEPELLERLFDPFSQAEQDLARTKGGLGLGLALTKGLAELHGGTVTARSEGRGRGASFTLQVPLSASVAPSAARGYTPKVDRAGVRILVVEDNHDAAETLGDLLEIAGHEVRLAFDGPSAVSTAREFHPSVVISDLGLPGAMDGYSVAKALRADPATHEARLIALSGYANEEVRQRSFEAGFHLHMAKPPDLGKLERAISECLGG